MKQCAKGHLYDETKNAVCPYCNGPATQGKAVPLTEGYNGGFNVVEALESIEKSDNGFKPTVAPGITSNPFTETVAPDMGVGNPFGETVAVNENRAHAFRAAVGWLVVIDGPYKGRDFALHTGDNTVGKKESNTVALDFDDYVSRERCVIVTYDDRGNRFYISKGQTKNNIYINDRILLSDRELCDYDVIEIGKTKLVFRTLCNDQFKYPED